MNGGMGDTACVHALKQRHVVVCGFNFETGRVKPVQLAKTKLEEEADLMEAN